MQFLDPIRLCAGGTTSPSQLQKQEEAQIEQQLRDLLAQADNGPVNVQGRHFSKEDIHRVLAAWSEEEGSSHFLKLHGLEGILGFLEKGGVQHLPNLAHQFPQGEDRFAKFVEDWVAHQCGALLKSAILAGKYPEALGYLRKMDHFRASGQKIALDIGASSMEEMRTTMSQYMAEDQTNLQLLDFKKYYSGTLMTVLNTFRPEYGSLRNQYAEGLILLAQALAKRSSHDQTAYLIAVAAANLKTSPEVAERIAMIKGQVRRDTGVAAEDDQNQRHFRNAGKYTAIGIFVFMLLRLIVSMVLKSM